jgi:hypothetical protein
MTQLRRKSQTVATAISKGVQIKADWGLQFTKARRPTDAYEGGVVITKVDLTLIIIDSVMEPVGGPNHSIATLR